MADPPPPPTYASLSEKEKEASEQPEGDTTTQYPPPSQPQAYPTLPPGPDPTPPQANPSYPPGAPQPYAQPYPGPPPGQPGFQPGQPGFQPGPQPGQPGYQPGQPGPPLGQPGYQPGQPGPPPGQPGYQPGQPGYQPGQPGYQPGPPPGQPGYQPGPPPGSAQPGFQPGAPVNPPYHDPNFGLPAPGYPAGTTQPLLTLGETDNTAMAGGYPKNPNAPGECELRKPEEFPDMAIAEGQRTHIDQLEAKSTQAWGKWACVAFWTIAAHVGFFACIGLLIWQVPLKMEYDEWWESASYAERYADPQPHQIAYNRTTLICAGVFLVLFWVIGVTEGCLSDTEQYVDNIKKISAFRKDHQRVRTTVPIVIWEANAFHYDKERTVWKDGVMISRRRSSDIHKCISYQKKIAFPFSRCVDASGDLEAFKTRTINRFEFEKTFGFLDTETQEQYKAMKEAFINEAKYKDEDHTFEETLILPDMKERETVFMEEGCRTRLMSANLYYCLTCFLLTWPYRLFFRCATRKQGYTYIKLIAL